MTSEKRRYIRVAPKGLVSNAGKLILDPKKPALDCAVLDLSAGGARLSINLTTPMPKSFEFLHGGVKRKCSLVWQRGFRIGVAY